MEGCANWINAGLFAFDWNRGRTGTVCVASRAATPFRGQVVPPTGEVSSGGLQVKVDKRPAVPWPPRESLKIEGLDVKERHLLALVDSHGKPVESLRFRFVSYKSVHLCMSYDGYGGIGLQEDARCPWCRCKYRSPVVDRRL
jgi:hypothetical protein